MIAPKLYAALAHLWTLLSPRDDYVAEAAEIRKILDQQLDFSGADRPLRLMELGAGSGQSLSLLGTDVEALAIDVCPEMVGLCRRLYPNIRTLVGDMRSVRCGETFDAVLAYDAIDYIVDIDDLASTCATAAAHLTAGGLFIVAPSYVTENFQEGDVVLDVNSEGDLEVAYVARVKGLSPPSGGYILDMTILIREAGMLRIEADSHPCGLFPVPQWVETLRVTGFDLVATPEMNAETPSSMFVCTRRA